MNVSRFFFALTTFLVGCTGSVSQQAQQTETLLHALRTEIEEVKSDLGSHQMELNILEGKLVAQEDSLIQLREESLQKAFVKLEKLQVVATQMERRASQLEKLQEETLAEVKQMVQLAQDVQKTSLIYKERFGQLDDKLEGQQLLLTDLMRLKKELLLQLASVDQPMQYYKVKAGDTLEKIARQTHTSVEFLKKTNRLSGDQILVGDSLLVPASV